MNYLAVSSLRVPRSEGRLNIYKLIKKLVRTCKNRVLGREIPTILKIAMDNKIDIFKKFLKNFISTNNFFSKHFTSKFIYNFNKFNCIVLYTGKLQILQTINSLFAL